ncbi:MAG: hydrogenase maturation nickel metallochaperone HypA [Blastocatellia bacterium]|nr:hydrogenase maturation nickel metallochaperone HypA [Blastocatellia bacterium]
MHEAAIVQGLLDIAIGEAIKHGSPRINRIKIRLGAFRGVVREALEFSFAAMRHGTLAQHAVLEIETIPLRVQCADCGEIELSPRDFSLLCPQCDEPVAILAGREMQIEYVDLD